jgi:hypothetical protein
MHRLSESLADARFEISRSTSRTTAAARGKGLRDGDGRLGQS